MPTVALVGYTNAGKSSLLKALSGADVFIEDRLFATLDTLAREVDVGDTEVVEPTLAFLEEQDELVPGAIVVAHPDRLLVPYQRLPKLEPRPLGLGLHHEHRLGVAVQVEVPVLLEDPEGLFQQLGESGVWKDPEPVVTR